MSLPGCFYGDDIFSSPMFVLSLYPEIFVFHIQHHCNLLASLREATALKEIGRKERKEMRSFMQGLKRRHLIAVSPGSVTPGEG